MSDPSLRLPRPAPVGGLEASVPVGRQLVNSGTITVDDLIIALDQQRYVDALLGDILVAENLVQPDTMLDAVARQHQAERVDLAALSPKPEMAHMIPASVCQSHFVVPWRKIGDTLLVATARPDLFGQIRACMGPRGAQMLPVVAPLQDIMRAIGILYGTELAQRAVTRVPPHESCRGMDRLGFGPMLCLFMLVAGSFYFVAVQPAWALTACILIAALCLALTTGLKAAAFITQIAHGIAVPDSHKPHLPQGKRLPKVSVMVPLFEEQEITKALVSRLSRLSYPKSLLDIVLVIEAKDDVTRATLARADLPPWMSVVEVPDDGEITTKPRALNYALGFCKGSIIGVWDAEDAPALDQLERVVERFEKAPSDVACLQGILDYYNSRTNWLSRCFTIEYAMWWRVVLPGIARLGLIVPLGGTTLFFRRDILEKLGAWDAHNVTEDADLGLRLARHGYRTELIPTVTLEEANCLPWRWVRQRSRWMKGFLITYLVHMRSPRTLLRDVGAWRFFGIQILFMASFAQVALAPALWTFWLLLLGLPHPVQTTLTPQIVGALIIFFIASELLNLTMGCLAVSSPTHRHLIPSVLLMPIYFILGTFAAVKALYEMIRKPFFWDKTEHGLSDGPDIIPLSDAPRPGANGS
ncbi:MAG: glycosyltransferase [Paracoccaceae bacterium]